MAAVIVCSFGTTLLLVRISYLHRDLDTAMSGKDVGWCRVLVLLFSAHTCWLTACAAHGSGASKMAIYSCIPKADIMRALLRRGLLCSHIQVYAGHPGCGAAVCAGRVCGAAAGAGVAALPDPPSCWRATIATRHSSGSTSNLACLTTPTRHTPYFVPASPSCWPAYCTPRACLCLCIIQWDVRAESM